MRGDRSITRPLTDEERALVERHHNIIYRVMNDLTLPSDPGFDMYGECALGLIGAAQRYSDNPWLQKYSFNTVAYAAIRSAIWTNMRNDLKHISPYSLEFEFEDGMMLESVVACDDHEPKAASPQTMKIYRKVKKKLTAKQMAALSLYANGFSYSEASQISGINASTLKTHIRSAKRKLLPMADELFGTKKSARQAGT